MLRYFSQTGRKFQNKMYAMVCVFGCEQKISGRMLKKYTALSLRRGISEVDGKGRRGWAFPLGPFSSAWIALFYFYSLIIKSGIDHSSFCLVGLLWGSNVNCKPLGLVSAHLNSDCGYSHCSFHQIIHLIAPNRNKLNCPTNGKDLFRKLPYSHYY